MQTHGWTGEILVDYNQFYLWDSGRTDQAPTEYTDDDVHRRIKACDHVIVIQPERNGAVPVAIECHDSEPPNVLARWDHVAEASVHLPSGALQVHECLGGAVTEFQLPPGWYRVRSFHAELGTVDGTQGRDHYVVVIWPAAPGPVAVIEQFDHGTAAV
ncbi:MAG: hypothetical protein JWO31_3941 [Phycisphaerales bacterium]|nr:hypothetical protein [Phycisphaerales bacterium]